MHGWFVIIVFVWNLICVFGCVCPLLSILITSGMIWTLYDCLNKFYTFYMAAVVGIVSRHSLSNDEYRRNQPNNSKLLLYYEPLTLALTIILHVLLCGP